MGVVLLALEEVGWGVLCIRHFEPEFTVFWIIPEIMKCPLTQDVGITFASCSAFFGVVILNCNGAVGLVYNFS